jgi:hypothetical protein
VTSWGETIIAAVKGPTYRVLGGPKQSKNFAEEMLVKFPAKSKQEKQALVYFV